jgi:hypothetical protein
VAWLGWLLFTPGERDGMGWDGMECDGIGSDGLGLRLVKTCRKFATEVTAAMESL